MARDMSLSLTSLRIRNLALVEDILWEPRPGLTAVTGETGTGKSVLIGAIKFLVGERADKGAIRSGARQCSIEATWRCEGDERIAALLDAAGIDPCEDGQLIIKRTLTVDEPSRQFINGSACKLSVLADLGELLVDLHGPHDHQSLFSRERQTLLLDGYAGCEAQREAFAEARKQLAALENEMAAILADEQSAARELETLRHQTSEIRAAELRPDEEEELVTRHRQAANATRIVELCGQMQARLAEEEFSLESTAAECVRLARDLEKLDPAAESLHGAANETAAAIAAFEDTLRSYADKCDTDPAALAAIEARLDIVTSLKRKYGATLGDVLAFCEQAEQRLAVLESRTERAGSLDEEISAASAATRRVAEALTAKRTAAAKKLQKAVSEQLRDLGFLKCGFTVTLEPRETPQNALGAELAEFLFAPNPGEPPQPLRTIASSGEISRVMLALKSVLAEQDRVPLLVFDEIDANVGGEVATRVGRRMRELAANRQVFCITHLPQVAAAATEHFVVTKTVRDGRTHTQLDLVETAERESEIARMVGGQSASALAHARELLGN